MTFSNFLKMYEHYKTNYDFQLKKISYEELREKVAQSEEWIPD